MAWCLWLGSVSDLVSQKHGQVLGEGRPRSIIWKTLKYLIQWDSSNTSLGPHFNHRQTLSSSLNCRLQESLYFFQSEYQEISSKKRQGYYAEESICPVPDGYCKKQWGHQSNRGRSRQWGEPWVKYMCRQSCSWAYVRHHLETPGTEGWGKPTED